MIERKNEKTTTETTNTNPSNDSTAKFKYSVDKKTWKKARRSTGSKRSKWMKIMGTFTLVTAVMVPVLFWTLYLQPLIDEGSSIPTGIWVTYVYFVCTMVYGFTWGVITIVRGYKWPSSEYLNRDAYWLWWALAHALLGALPLALHHVTVWRSGRRNKKLRE